MLAMSILQPSGAHINTHPISLAQNASAEILLPLHLRLQLTHMTKINDWLPKAQVNLLKLVICIGRQEP